MRDTSRYQLDGQRVLSVTEALDIAGLVDFSGVPLSLLEEAAERGKRVHAAIATMIDAEVRGDEAWCPDDEVGYINAFLRFRTDTGFEVIENEYPVLSKRYRYAGTLDLFGIIETSLCLLDLKTGVIPEWTGLQTAGYEMALRETKMGHWKLDPNDPIQRYGLQLKPDGTYKLKRFETFSDRADFLASVRVAQYKLKTGGWSLDQ